MSQPPPRPPEWQERLGLRLFRTLSPKPPAGKAAPAPTHLLPFKNLFVECSCGSKLSAMWFPAYLTPRGAVLLLHPWAAHGGDYFHRQGRIEALRAAGYHALTIDFPGFGASGGPGALYDRAVESALGLLGRLSKGLDLFVWGVSTGGYWAHPALARTDQVAGAMFEDVSPHLLERSGRGVGWGRAAYLFFKRLLPGVYRYLDARLHATAFDLGAVTYVSGARGGVVRPEDTRVLAERAGGSYSIVRGAGHLGSIKVANRAVIRTALETLERASENSTTAMMVEGEEEDSQISAVG